MPENPTHALRDDTKVAVFQMTRFIGCVAVQSEQDIGTVRRTTGTEQVYGFLFSV